MYVTYFYIHNATGSVSWTSSSENVQASRLNKVLEKKERNLAGVILSNKVILAWWYQSIESVKRFKFLVHRERCSLFSEETLKIVELSKKKKSYATVMLHVEYLITT